MAFLSLIFVACLGVQSVVAHYHFNYLMINGTFHPKWRYVRVPQDQEQYLPYPLYDLASLDYRCGRNATVTGPGTDIATIVAGEVVGVRPSLTNNRPGTTFFHDGPLFAYLSKSPTQTREGLQNWDGDGNYFKIAQRGPDTDNGWFTNTYKYNLTTDSWNFTIPSTTPPGLYLLRAESIYPKAEFNRTQFYASCAQVQILGPGGGTEPGPTVKFPGAFDNFHEGVLITQELATGKKGLDNYKFPGPTVWTG
ncbi:lytic polysaccharide monooxygenase [Amniculicola lignicola CBS 123094]|uniref:AA9 family lytic polysaccharide monooxygenase n=1 Tax=Amniculicola lignicola CBS 123094 TaxID=1392246 RepID=A0A6A5W582_9PLEO|nr:lytic polysaccharide monooxygenase [Amniculicola lignicola CBS 123094]